MVDKPPFMSPMIDLIRRRNDAMGLQFAHIIGRVLYRDNPWVQRLMIGIELEDDPTNFELW